MPEASRPRGERGDRQPGGCPRAQPDVAEYFRRTEPQSIMPYALEQVVHWGKMSLPELLSELIPEEAAAQERLQAGGHQAAGAEEVPARRSMPRGPRRGRAGRGCDRSHRDSPFREPHSMSSASIHDKLSRVRKPRVHITYEVETEGAKVAKELPFVMGVLGDFSGKPTAAAETAEGPQVHPDRPRQFQRRHGPHDARAELPGREHAQGRRQRDGGAAQVQLDGRLRARRTSSSRSNRCSKLLETRNKLRDLLTKVDRSDELEDLLEKVLKNTNELKKLSAELGVSGPTKAHPEGRVDS